MITSRLCVFIFFFENQRGWCPLISNFLKMAWDRVCGGFVSLKGYEKTECLLLLAFPLGGCESSWWVVNYFISGRCRSAFIKRLGQFMSSWLCVVPVSRSSHALSDKLSGTFECLPRGMSSFWRVEQGYLGFPSPLISPRYFLTTVKRGSSRCKETLVLIWLWHSRENPPNEDKNCDRGCAQFLLVRWL